jgi:elongation factor 1-alpha
MQNPNEIANPKIVYKEIVVDIVGNVDSGKSSLCGILSHPLVSLIDKESTEDILDDGNGSSKARIVKLKHEKSTGRTSSITYYPMVFNNTPHPKIVSLVDLAGHDQYLKTTITGIISSYPEHGLVLIAKTITHMTKEHFSILASLGIPVLFVLTKCDIIPLKAIVENIKSIEMLSKRFGRTLMEIKNSDDVNGCLNGTKVFGFIRVSNKTGLGIPILVNYISKIKQKPKSLINGFAIDRFYHNITGFGMVATGITGIEIKKGDNMILGPFEGNLYIPVKIRTIHDDYRNFTDVLHVGRRGCLCIKVDDAFKPFLRIGMVIAHTKSDINSVKKFEAYVAIFRGKSSSIKVGYNSYINVGLTRAAIRFTRIRNKDTGLDLEVLDNTKHAHVDLEFMSGYACLNINDRFLFRSHRTHGIGKVIALF